MRRFLFVLVVALMANSSSAQAQLVINATFDATITGNVNAAAMMTGINNAIAQIQSKFTNPVTVNILFQNMNSGLGQSSTFFNTPSYTQYRSDLLNNQILSANDVTATNTLPAGPNNPVNAGQTMFMTLPLLRALGEAALGNNGGGFDSTIGLNMSLMNFLRTGPQDANKYDLEQVTLHEIAEVLGGGGAGSSLGSGGSNIGPLDLFRYSANGVRSFDVLAPTSYFSIDGGATNLSYFNQVAGADYGDWAGNQNSNPQPQDAFSTPGVQLDLTENELIALDVVGWNRSLAAVPEPSPAILAACATVVFGLYRRTRRV